MIPMMNEYKNLIINFVKEHQKGLKIALLVFLVGGMIFKGLMQIPQINASKAEVAKLTNQIEYEQERQKEIEELKENNTAPAEAWEVIEKGASLIGSVMYSMEQRQLDGRDNLEFLDCSSFTACAFHKSGITSVPYASTTATFISSKKFEDISGDKLQPGDIGLKSKTGGTGGANHVGIYCGKMKNGTVVWIHCTSSSSTSLTGNSEGAMFGAYTNFTYFRRLKKWNKD